MSNLKFSVAMCVYGGDRADWFKIAVDSILNQTVKPSEVVLVVDGPVPEELNVVICEYEKMDIWVFSSLFWFHILPQTTERLRSQYIYH